MKKHKHLLMIFSFTIFILCGKTFSEISFLSTDLNNKGDILFTVKVTTHNASSYNTLFLYTKENNKIEQLTFSPERLELLGDNRFLQISNKFGILRIDLTSKSIYKKSYFETLTKTDPVKLSNVTSIQSSPDGRWLSLIEPVTHSHGNLILNDTLTDMKYVLSKNAIRNSEPIKWSPDSKTFLYENGNNIYFARTDWFQSDSLPNIEFRKFAEGSIKNIKWISAKEFVFLSDCSLYKVAASELFTKAFYSPLFQLGELLVNLPMKFTPAFDFFSLSPDCKSAVFIQNNRQAYFLKFGGDDYLGLKNAEVIPYLLLPGNTAKVTVHWNRNLPIIFSQGLANGKEVLKIWKLYKESSAFQKIELNENSELISVSPDAEIIIVKKDAAILFLNVNGTSMEKTVSYIDNEDLISAVWKNPFSVLLGGKNSIFEYSFNKEKNNIIKRKLYDLSVNDYSWSTQGDKILGKLDSSEIAEYNGTLEWLHTKESALNKKQNKNLSDRIYIDKTTGYFENMIYIRSLHNYKTTPLLNEPYGFVRFNKFEKKEIENTSTVFSHGNRKGKNQVAFVFDAVEDMNGIAEILYTLKKNNISATFFINGNAIHRNLFAVKEIVSAGHQCGSLFFTNMDFTNTNYMLDEKFIMQGLARNEDIFYAATNSELSLIWHTPNYILSPLIAKAGKKAGYVYVSPDIIIPDWITSNDKNKTLALYKNSAAIIEDICAEISPGSIIPIRLGKTFPERIDYLYSNLQLLIDAVTEMGYTITDIQSLMKEAAP